MITEDRVFIDTNVLVYLANKDSPFYDKTISLLTNLSKKYSFVISNQIIREFLVISTNPNKVENPLNLQDAIQFIEILERHVEILYENEFSKKKLFNLLIKYRIKGKKIHDVNIVSVMSTNNVKTLFTFNIRDFKKFEEIKIIKID